MLDEIHERDLDMDRDARVTTASLGRCFFRRPVSNIFPYQDLLCLLLKRSLEKNPSLLAARYRRRAAREEARPRSGQALGPHERHGGCNSVRCPESMDAFPASDCSDVLHLSESSMFVPDGLMVFGSFELHEVPGLLFWSRRAL